MVPGRFKLALLTLKMTATRFLIFVRHSAVQIEPNRSSHEWSLSEEGRARCRQLSQQLKPYNPSIYITSEESKAIATGQILATEMEIFHKSAPGLQEHDRQEVPYFSDEASFRAAVDNLFANPEKLVFGNETADQALSRFSSAVHRELENEPYGNVAFVTHGTVLTLFVCSSNPQLKPIEFWKSLALPCAVILDYPGLFFQETIFI